MKFDVYLPLGMLFWKEKQIFELQHISPATDLACSLHLKLNVPQYFSRSCWPFWIISWGYWNEIRNHDSHRRLKEHTFNFVFGIVHSDGLALLGTTPSASMVMTKFGSYVYTYDWHFYVLLSKLCSILCDLWWVKTFEKQKHVYNWSQFKHLWWNINLFIKHFAHWL